MFDPPSGHKITKSVNYLDSQFTFKIRVSNLNRSIERKGCPLLEDTCEDEVFHRHFSRGSIVRLGYSTYPEVHKNHKNSYWSRKSYDSVGNLHNFLLYVAVCGQVTRLLSNSPCALASAWQLFSMSSLVGFNFPANSENDLELKP